MFLFNCIKTKFYNGIENIIILTGNCVFTREIYTVTIREFEYNRILSGANIQDVLLDTFILDREFLISGISPEYYKKEKPEFYQREIIKHHQKNVKNTGLIDKEASTEKNHIVNQKLLPHYLFFDTETTGLPKNWRASVNDLNNWPRLVQLAYLLYDNVGNLISEGNYIVKPEGFTIPTDVSSIHGITTEKALKEGNEISTILNHFNSLIKKSHCLVHIIWILMKK